MIYGCEEIYYDRLLEVLKIHFWCHKSGENCDLKGSWYSSLWIFLEYIYESDEEC